MESDFGIWTDWSLPTISPGPGDVLGPPQRLGHDAEVSQALSCAVGRPGIVHDRPAGILRISKNVHIFENLVCEAVRSIFNDSIEWQYAIASIEQPRCATVSSVELWGPCGRQLAGSS